MTDTIESGLAATSERAPARVVVVGAGYAGVMAANRLAAKGGSDVRITVVNPRAEFVERIRLHEYAAAGSPPVIPLEQLLDRRVRLVTAHVVGIRDRVIDLDDGATLDFDRLVYAVGSRSVVQGGTHTVDSLTGAARLHEQLRTASPGDWISVVGGGLTGVETAAEIARGWPGLRVRLVSSGTVVPSISERGRRATSRRLARLGVEVCEHRTARGQVDCSLLLEGAGAEGSVERLRSDHTVWAASFGVPDLARRSGLPVDDAGRLVVDETLRCPGHCDIVGVGDAVAPPDAVASHIRMSCQAALVLGAHGADTILASLRNCDPEPLSMGFILQCISLGTGSSAVVQTTRADDSPRRIVLSGRTGAFVKEQICRSTIRWMRDSAGRYRWASGPAPARDVQEVAQ